MAPEDGSAPDAGDRPPFFLTWRGAYAFVLGALVLEVLLFTWLAGHFP